MKKNWTLVTFLFLSLFLGQGVLIKGITFAAAKEIKFACIYPFSGPAASWGINDYRAYMIGSEIINEAGGFTVQGQKYFWKIVSYDSKFTPEGTVAGVEWAINTEKVNFLSTMGGGQTLAVIPKTEPAKILNISVANPTPNLPPSKSPLTFFGAAQISDTTWIPLIQWVKKKHGLKTMAVLQPDYVVGKVAASTTVEAAKRAGVDLVAQEMVSLTASDFYPTLTKILTKNPDMIMTGINSSRSASLILKQARELGYKGIVFLPWGPSVKDVLEIAGPQAEGVYANGLIYWDTPWLQEVKKRYSAKWDINEADIGVIGFAGTLRALTEAIVKADSFDTTKVAAKFQDEKWDAYAPKDSGWWGAKKVGIKRLAFNSTVQIFKFEGGKAKLLDRLTVTVDE
ncbi:MAG: ABC transporter substrate-binding protein [Thermodesulfobacteriota bacterium]